MQEEPDTAGFYAKGSAKWQYLLDKSSPHIAYRWISFAMLFSFYALRVFALNGWYIVTYGLGIYLLNQFIGFISPQVRILFVAMDWKIHCIKRKFLNFIAHIYVYMCISIFVCFNTRIFTVY